MNGNRVALEQFASVPPSRVTGIAPGFRLGPEDPLPTLDLTTDPAEELDADSDPGGFPPMGEPPIRRAPLPTADPRAEEVEALRENLALACTRLTEVIDALGRDRDTALQAAIAEVSGEIATVGAEVLASVVDSGIAAEIAAAVAELAARIPHPAVELRIADDDHATLAAAIAAHAPDTEITLVSDPGLTTGQARMSWPEGGADLDAATVMARIAPLIAERLNDQKSRSQ